MDEQIPEELKESRYEELMLVQNSIIKDINCSRIGKVYETLIERYETLFDRYVGRTYMSAPDGIDGVVYIRTDKELKIGEYYPIKIIDYRDYDLIGIMNEKE